MEREREGREMERGGEREREMERGNGAAAEKERGERDGESGAEKNVRKVAVIEKETQ